ncbi:MAG: hypothetical protein Q7K33_02270 [Candidatus Berkelbacteria bacterium]|nr:hypothetical protein [Candidatus Berkelbacteria bacterium]
MKKNLTKSEPSQALMTWWIALGVGALLFTAGMIMMFGLYQDPEQDWIFIGGTCGGVGAIGLWYAGNVPKPKS